MSTTPQLFKMLILYDFNQISIFLLYNVSITVQGGSLWQCKPYSGDTDSYLLIRRSIEKPAYKEKLRIRSYSQTDDNSTVFVELKKKYKHVVRSFFNRCKVICLGIVIPAPAFSKSSGNSFAIFSPSFTCFFVVPVFQTKLYRLAFASILVPSINTADSSKEISP